MEFTAEDLESALLSIPMPSASMPDSGTSLREAIAVLLFQTASIWKLSSESWILHMILFAISYAILYLKIYIVHFYHMGQTQDIAQKIIFGIVCVFVFLSLFSLSISYAL